MSVIYTECNKEMISRNFYNSDEKITVTMVKKCMSNHITDHLNLTKKDICNRFLKGKYKETSSKNYQLSNKQASRISWFNNEDLAYNYCAAALNSNNIKNQIRKWLNLWDRSQGYSFEIRVSTKNSNLGKFVTKKGDWNNFSICSNLIIVLGLESMSNVENAGFTIKTIYPVPTPEEQRIHDEKVIMYYNDKNKK